MIKWYIKNVREIYFSPDHQTVVDRVQFGFIGSESLPSVVRCESSLLWQKVAFLWRTRHTYDDLSDETTDADKFPGKRYFCVCCVFVCVSPHIHMWLRSTAAHMHATCRLVRHEMIAYGSMGLGCALSKTEVATLRETTQMIPSLWLNAVEGANVGRACMLNRPVWLITALIVGPRTVTNRIPDMLIEPELAQHVFLIEPA